MVLVETFNVQWMKIRLLSHQVCLIKINLLIDISFCRKNENKSNEFIKKLHHFTNGKYRVSTNWIKKKVKSLFLLKDNNIYPACKIYHGFMLL